MWIDGICKSCGCFIIEIIANCSMDGDYINMCTNRKCINYRWHIVYDDEELEYYKHGKVNITRRKNEQTTKREAKVSS